MNAKLLKLRLFFSLGDLFTLLLSFLLSYYLVFDKLNISQNYIFLFIILCLNWLLIGLFFNLFNYSRGERTEIMFSNLLKAFIVNCLIITTFLFCLKSNTFSKEYLGLSQETLQIFPTKPFHSPVIN